METSGDISNTALHLPFSLSIVKRTTRLRMFFIDTTRFTFTTLEAIGVHTVVSIATVFVLS